MTIPKSLQFRTKSLLESSETCKSFGSISFNHCPSCFSQLDKEIQSGRCALCKNDIPEFGLEEKYTEVLTELIYQEKQNKNTIEKLHSKFLSLKAGFSENSEVLNRLQNELKSISTNSNDRELLISEYAKLIANVEGEISELHNKIPLIQELETLIEKISEISGEINILEMDLASREKKSEERKKSVFKSLGSIATSFLENCSGNENDFKTASSKSVEIDFEKDRWLLGERVSFSESSNAEKKSALHISFLIHSMEDLQTRYPLFSIMDFECSDLNEARSQKIQTNILDLLKDKKDFQLLITSSKIAKELNNDEYGIGRFYGKNDYIFKL